jgi:hypothetical protein
LLDRRTNAREAEVAAGLESLAKPIAALGRKQSRELAVNFVEQFLDRPVRAPDAGQ